VCGNLQDGDQGGKGDSAMSVILVILSALLFLGWMWLNKDIVPTPEMLYRAALLTAIWATACAIWEKRTR
jgi:hypothetical protein